MAGLLEWRRRVIALQREAALHKLSPEERSAIYRHFDEARFERKLLTKMARLFDTVGEAVKMCDQDLQREGFAALRGVEDELGVTRLVAERVAEETASRDRSKRKRRGVADLKPEGQPARSRRTKRSAACRAAGGPTPHFCGN